MAWRGEVWFGTAGQAWRGKSGCGLVRHVGVWYGKAGKVRRGEAR
jgi:hypothetical protein